MVYPSDPLPAPYRGMGAVGILFFFVGMAYAPYRSLGTVAPERVIAVAVIIALMAFGQEISGAALLIAIDLILLATLVLEHHRIDGVPSRGSDPSLCDGA